MMFHHPVGRNQRAKGSKAKNILQATVLLAVVVWLLYQTKHSYDRKNDYAETNYNKLRKGGTDINFGRKINAGSENRNSIDPRGKNSDETAEMGKSGEGQDVFYQNNEEKAEELKIESEESREDITNSGMEETQQEPKGNVEYNGDSHSADEVNTEGKHDSIRLPSQTDGNNFDQNEGGNADGNSVEENGLLKDGATSAEGTNSSDRETITSDEASSSTSQIRTGENAGQGSETNETSGEHSDTALLATEELSSSSASDDQSNKNISDDNDAGKGETVESQEGAGSDTETANNYTVEAATTNPRSDDEIVTENSNLPNSTEENNVVSVNDEAPKREGESHLAKIASNSSLEAATSGASSEGENIHFPKSVEENVVMPDSNGAPVREEGESQVDRVSEDQVTGNSSIEAVIADTSSEGENANLPNSEEKGEVMSDVNGAPKWEEVQSQTDHVSKVEKADNNSLEEANSDRRSASEASETEADVSQGANASEAEVTTNNTVKQEYDSKSNDEAANNSSLTNGNEHVELPANGDEAVVEDVQSQGNSTSVAENPDKNSLGEDKSKKSDDLVTNSAQNNEQSNSELPTSETPNGEVASHEDSALKGESTSENVEDAMADPQSKDAMADPMADPQSKDAMADPQSKDATTTDSGSSDDRTAEAQEDSTGSGSYNSGSQEDIKKSAEL